VELLEGLYNWNTKPNHDPDNSFLMIYSHMGPSVLSPVGARDPKFDPRNLVRYEDLELNLPYRVHTLWLVGCSSHHARRAFHPVHGPVRGLLLATTSSELWKPLVSRFGEEVNMHPPRCFDQMIPYIKRNLPRKLGRHVSYFEPVPRWRRAFRWWRRFIPWI
jgi:hypothetical protein